MKAIVCVDNNWGIGKNNKLLYRLPLDLQYFYDTVKDKITVMGYNTYKSLKKGVGSRINIVITHKELVDCICVHSIEALLEMIKKYDEDEVYVLGGESIYKSLLPYCNEVLVTKVDATTDADAYFPNIDDNEEFYTQEESEEYTTNGYTIKFLKYRRKH